MESMKNSPILQRAEKETMVGMDRGLIMEEWIKVCVTHLKAQDDLERAKAGNGA
jgi:predicted component of type VI protein secretion system